MAQYIVDNTRPVNKNGRNNYTRGDNNTFVSSTSEEKKYYLTSYRIVYKYANVLSRDDRGFANSDVVDSMVQYVKKELSFQDTLFGYDNNEYILTFPPYYKKYYI
jgi:hypothetical protein